MLLSGLLVQDRRPLGPTRSLLDRQPTAPDLLVPLGLPLPVLDQCVVACRPRQRLTTSHQVLTMPLHRSLLHSLFRRRHLLPRYTRYRINPIASRIPTTVPSRAVFLHLHHRHLPAWGVHLPKARLKAPLGMLGLPARHWRCDQSSRIAQILPATAIKDRISIILILPRVVASLMALLHLRLLWWLLKPLHATELTIVPLLRHRKGIASGRTMITSTLSRLPTMRSVRSLRSHTVVDQLLPIPCHHPRLRVIAHTARQMLDVSTTVTTRPKLRITHRRFLRWEQHRRRPACRRPLSKSVLNNMSRLRAKWRSTRTTMMNLKKRRRTPQHLSVVAHVTLLP